jgi:hypothetical protein
MTAEEENYGAAKAALRATSSDGLKAVPFKSRVFPQTVKPGPDMKRASETARMLGDGSKAPYPSQYPAVIRY